jgi:hypothetical protein
MSLKSALETLSPRVVVTDKGYNAETEQFQFDVKINGQSFAYHMGTGHAKAPPEGYKGHQKDWRTNRSIFGTEFRDHWYVNPKSHPTPDLSDVVECLLSDAQAGAQSFEDFCSDFGYDVNSREAERTHNACRDNLCKLLRAFGFDGIATLQQAMGEE